MRTFLALLLAARAIALDAGGEQPIPAAWREAIATTANGYEWRLARIGDGLAIAPTLCEMPPPVTARISAAEGGTPHARKVYRLYASQPQPYLKSREIDQPPGQAVVKDAFAPLLVASEAQHDGPHGDRPVRADGHWLAAGERHGLFLMLKVGDAAMPGTDAGWIYATVAADRATITACGRLAACMSCHQDAPRDRLFGVKPPPAPEP